MSKDYFEPGSPYLSETYCSDEDFLENIIKREKAMEEKPMEKPDPYLSKTYCSDEDYYERITEKNRKKGE